MRNVYIVEETGHTRIMEYVHCHDEDKELQSLLEKNHDLLAGNQINPESPVRWLLIKREMPVPDPESAENRWNIDFLFADNLAIPTFVECKRFLDTRSRREVVGQMMEYVANGQYYWDSKALKSYAQETASKNNKNLDELLFTLQSEKNDLRDNFFDAVEQNLKEGQVRLVFFMEEAPTQLKSIVEFMNNQMEKAEILIVEARQYRDKDTKIVVPTLFGYTEQARQVKKPVLNVPSANIKIKRDKSSFVEELASLNEHKRFEIIMRLMDFVEANSDCLKGEFGIGKTATFIIKNNRNRTLCSVYITGEFQVYATATCLPLFEAIDALRSEHLTDLNWKTPFSQGNYPVISKKLENLDEIQISRILVFLENVAICTKDYDGKSIQ